MTFGALALGAFAGLLALQVHAQTVQDLWIVPVNPNFATTFEQGEQVTLQWSAKLVDNFGLYCKTCDVNDVDLWLVSGDDDVVRFKIAGNIDVNTTLTQDWTVLVPDQDLEGSPAWGLRFIPAGTLPFGAGSEPQISSPQFNIDAPPTTTTTATTSTPPPTSTSGSLASATSTTATTTPSAVPQGDSGLSTGAAAGIGVGIGLVALAAIALLAFFLIRRKRKAKRDANVPEVQSLSPLDYSRSPPPGDESAFGGTYFASEPKKADPSSPAPPYAPAVSEAGYNAQPQKPVVHELYSDVDPVELSGDGYYAPR